jgi:hypothetical protein
MKAEEECIQIFGGKSRSKETNRENLEVGGRII